MTASANWNPLQRLGARTRAVAVPCATALLFLAAFAAPPAASAGQPPQLGGFWQLDLDKSETLQQKLDALRSSGAMPPPGGGGWHGGMGGIPGMGGMGHHGGGGYGGGPRDGSGHGASRDSTRRAQLNELAHPPLSLRIEQTADTFVLSERGRPIEVLALGDAAVAGSIQPDAPHLQAQWKGKHLVAEKEGPRGRMTQELELAEGGKQLIVRTRLEGRDGRPPLELKRVYNRSDGEEPEPAPPAPLAPTPPRPAGAAEDSLGR